MLCVRQPAAGTTLPLLGSCTPQPERVLTHPARAAPGVLPLRADWRRPEGGGRPASSGQLALVPGVAGGG